jgi:murein L,D-transpeptidase YcbB/YkuD
MPILATAWVLAGVPAVAQSPAGVRSQIAAAIPEAGALLGPWAYGLGASQALDAVYSGNGNAPLWSRDGRATPQAQSLLTELENAETYGLEVKDYGAPDIAAVLSAAASPGAADDQRWARFDVKLSAAALRFVSDLHYGRVSPEASGFKLREDRPKFDFTSALRGLAGAQDVKGALAATEPQFYHYKLLKDALARYRKVAQQREPGQLPAVQKAVKVGDAYPGTPALRRFLTATGDLPSGPDAPSGDAALDAALSGAVRNFQMRHGLDQSGQINKATLGAMNAPPTLLVRKIVLTLERWRWLTPFKTPPIIVNIPQFKLFAFRTVEDRFADILQMDVIVGRTFPQTQTPVFEGDMRYVILRPYWDVPFSITQHEMLPKIRANPAYLEAQHLEIAGGPDDSSSALAPTPENLAALAAGKLRLRQKPGEDNALGLAKFIFPNNYNVYLHSTPAHGLFKESVRAFSHGCIRVSDPLTLAALVLKDAKGDWTRDKIEAAMNGSTSVRVDLSRPVNVLILYATALATEAGPVFFFDDIYGYDKKLEEQLGLAPLR